MCNGKHMTHFSTTDFFVNNNHFTPYPHSKKKEKHLFQERYFSVNSTVMYVSTTKANCLIREG